MNGYTRCDLGHQKECGAKTGCSPDEPHKLRAEREAVYSTVLFLENAGIGQSTEAASRSRPGVQGRGEEKWGVTARGAGPECFGIK